MLGLRYRSRRSHCFVSRLVWQSPISSIESLRYLARVEHGAAQCPHAPRIRSVPSPERIYQGSVRAFSVVFIALGLLILIATLANGGGPLAVGTLLGIAFLAVGAGRLWIASRT